MRADDSLLYILYIHLVCSENFSQVNLALFSSLDCSYIISESCVSYLLQKSCVS